ncbi:hypothetical protein BD410DRAFT_774313 [Rickenella mellea]|uniref:Uncharacterized protein n=1 Tax=Rickenella mellea TaxID=50990 RepID=A0A4Y7PUP2_9AGAM|nr:hypothetical protein BD410DRAFT_774313 [Rickenella mellea]
MCHNVVDGRFHTQCGHFISMATRTQDCFQDDCVFSSRHPCECRSKSCIRKMNLPVKNPIRISKTMCGDCRTREKDTVLCERYCV